MNLNNSQLSMLSPAARAALMQHVGVKSAEGFIPQERRAPASTSSSSSSSLATESKVGVNEPSSGIGAISADFGMSQFWYDDTTAMTLAEEALSIGAKAEELSGLKRVACISCPSAYQAMIKEGVLPDDVETVLFEYDKRFEIYGDQFCFYDFNHPTKVGEEHIGSYDFILADPPYLTVECMTLTGETMRLLGRDGEKTPMLLNTGGVLKEDIERVLGLRYVVRPFNRGRKG